MVPTFNERENVVRLVELVKAVGLPGATILFVDDSSPDGTGEEIARISKYEPWVRLLTRKSKAGIGSAYQDGFKFAIETADPEMVLEMDADLQHPPSAVPALVAAVRGGADVAVASRYVEGGSVVGWGRWRRAVSKVANAYARTVLGIPVRDATSGFRAYSAAAARLVADAGLPAKGFEFQVASLNLLKRKMKIVEVPYSFSARSAGKSKLGTADMLRFFFSVIRLALA